MIGVEKTVEKMEAAGYKPKQWVYDMLATGASTFYKTENGVKQYYDIAAKDDKVVPGTEAFILLETLSDNKVLWKNAGASVLDLGDGILNRELHSKSNSMGGEVIEAINKAIGMAEKDFQGLVIANE